MKSIVIKVAAVVFFHCVFLSCNKKDNNATSNQDPFPPIAAVNEVDFWLTKADQSVLFSRQSTNLAFSTVSNQFPVITVDSTIKYQAIDGFGYTLTGGSAEVINSLNAGQKQALLTELFTSSNDGIGVSYLRLSIGASDLNSSVFTYDDLAPGRVDTALANFSLNPDKTDVIPLLKQIVAINPGIKIMATPWTAPNWMKTNDSTKGGRLKAQYYKVYANYFVKYIKAMQSEGINIDAITPQNEPLNPDNNPSMEMSSTEQADFIKNHLGPAFVAARLNTKIIVYDHNADVPAYPLAILNDPSAKAFVDGSAFHLYGGNINALSTVRNTHPDKNIYFTEQYTSSNGSFAGDLAWHVRNLIIGATRNWSRNVLEWNLANNGTYGPHTPGGCTECKGALTIAAGINRNVAYYIIAHAAKFVPPGSVRVASNITGGLQNVAFVTPAGKKVLIVLNDTNASQSFNIKFKDKSVVTGLDAGAVGTFVW